ncbi:MAG: gfo/Idh/MocA family oxidoreductase [bacterium]|nr:gfo/Idh/MocA family oxidoreductase [bacterium]
MTGSNKTSTIQRRGFLSAGAAASAGLLLVSSKTAFGAEANSALRMGVIGCGGRGNYVSGEFIRNTNTQIVALADLFDDRLKSTQEGLGKRLAEQGRSPIEDSRLYKGHEAYKDLLASELDMCLVTSPPYFHPIHLNAVVDAGKHVYCEKPVAVDVAGAKRVIEAGNKAKGKSSLMVGLQIRKSPEFQEVTSRVHQGDIGEIVSGSAWYHAGRLGARNVEGESEQDSRLRNWVFDQVLSGDIIVEQNIHVIDVVNWYLQSHPVKAFGTGGRKARVDVGDCWDHFLVTYWYPNDVRIDFSSSQFLVGWGDCRERIFGSKGVAESPYSGVARVTGEKAWQSEDKDLLDGAVAAKVRALEESIRGGDFVNEAQMGAQSTLTSILGRIAAYGEKVVTWDEMMQSNLELDPKLSW